MASCDVASSICQALNTGGGQKHGGNAPAWAVGPGMQLEIFRAPALISIYPSLGALGGGGVVWARSADLVVEGGLSLGGGDTKTIPPAKSSTACKTSYLRDITTYDRARLMPRHPPHSTTSTTFNHIHHIHHMQSVVP